MANKKTTDAVAILHRRLYKKSSARRAELGQVRLDDAVARQLLALRTKEGLSQRELAKRVGTTASVICRLEDADYDGHSMSMLNRIAEALGYRVELRFVRRAKKAA